MIYCMCKTIRIHIFQLTGTCINDECESDTSDSSESGQSVDIASSELSGVFLNQARTTEGQVHLVS